VIAGDFAAVAITLYVMHHVGDYWVQLDQHAVRKGMPGRPGRIACGLHVVGYIGTQMSGLAVLVWATDVSVSGRGAIAGLTFGAVAHYVIDRRTPLIWLAGLLPDKSRFLELGAPRRGVEVEQRDGMSSVLVGDNPQLATGMWALDQSAHYLLNVFVSALIVVGL
jgi:hypothetical protein